jgi:eukaryotic-like serine/threonine-protein kinase
MNEKNQIDSGTVLDGKYRIEKQVGAGGMGAVYMATHIAIGRRVAIKTLHVEFSGDAQVVARFHREAQLAGSIGHDNICEVTDIGRLESGAPYLVMPLLQGRPLADILEGSEALSLDRVADIGCQTLSALEAAHAAGIVHRDLKPDNIFVTKMGDRQDFVKLLDFGISKVLEQDEVTALTMTGTVLGTPFYMAPEQAKGAKNLDHRVDIYAMGVILYEALTGRRPFEGDTYNEIMFKIIAEPFAAPTALNPSVPLPVEQVIFKAMSREAADRFATAAEMRRALEAAALGLEVDFSARISAAPTIAHTSGTHGRTPMSAAYTPAAPGPSTSIRPGSKRGLAIGVALGAAALVAAGAIGFIITRGGPPEAPPISPAIVAPVPVPPPPVALPPPPVVAPAVPPPVVAPVAAQAPAAPEAVATTTAPASDKDASGKAGKKKRKADATATGAEAATADSGKAKDTVKGRFGTTFVNDYE